MDKKVTLNPVGQFLSVEHLFREREHPTPPVRRGIKKTESDGSKEEEEEIARLRNELRVFLSRPRVERAAGRSIGEWDCNKKAVKLVRKVGKFNEFGYTADRVEYLTNLQALFLLELNRLEIYWESVLVSLEQAYHLLLGRERSREYDKYLIYSTLSRAGYILQEFYNKSFVNTNEACTDVDCVWEILKSKLNPKHEIPINVKNHSEFNKLQSSMESIVEKTFNPASHHFEVDPPEVNLVLSSMKRKQPSTQSDNKSAKRQKLNYITIKQNESFIDFLKSEKEYQQFQDMFENVKIMELKAFEDYDDEISRELQIDFDLYFPNKHFKRTGNLRPDFRIITLGAEDKFPCRSELVKAYRSQRVAIPLLIASIGLSKQIQVFLYFFT